MPPLIACRIASYGEYHEHAWSHLPRIGIHHVEIKVPAAAELADVRRRLADCGLSASSLEGRCDIHQAEVVEAMKPQLATCAALGARTCFVSVHAGDLDRATVYQRLRAIGDIAAREAVTVTLETHPDLVTNGDVGSATMQAVGHPHVRVNFDTANVHYYNENVTALGELKKVLEHLGSLHLKDTDGGFHRWNFPALGQGVVDFPGVFRLLAERGFSGPCTMELEGTKDHEFDEAGRLKYVADSAAYLRRIGALSH